MRKRPICCSISIKNDLWRTSCGNIAGRPTSHSKRWCADALPLLDALVERGILGSPLPEASPLADPLRISNLTFNITNRCNLRCSWCYNQQSAGDDIPIPMLMNWVRRGVTSLDNDATFIILGGEPFLDERRLLECVRACASILREKSWCQRTERCWAVNRHAPWQEPTSPFKCHWIALRLRSTTPFGGKACFTGPLQQLGSWPIQVCERSSRWS